MTSGILHSERPTSNPSMGPHFDHAIRPWFLWVTVAVMTLLLVAIFVYGQIAPGA